MKIKSIFLEECTKVLVSNQKRLNSPLCIPFYPKQQTGTLVNIPCAVVHVSCVEF